MKELGKISFPEQYVPADESIVVDNSVAALAFFEEYYEKGGIVLLGTLQLFSLTVPHLLVWMYFSLDKENPRLISLIPACEVEDFDKLMRIPILKMTIHQHEIFFMYKDTLYASLCTSKGEIVLMKVRALLNAVDAASAIELMHGASVTDIFPVELYSHTEHKFVGVCWAATVEDDDEKLFWYPICLDETEAIGAYPLEDLSDHPINVGETAVIGGETYLRCYTEKTGTYFRKLTVPSLELLSRIQEACKQQRDAKKN